MKKQFLIIGSILTLTLIAEARTPVGQRGQPMQPEVAIEGQQLNVAHPGPSYNGPGLDIICSDCPVTYQGKHYPGKDYPGFQNNPPPQVGGGNYKIPMIEENAKQLKAPSFGESHKGQPGYSLLEKGRPNYPVAYPQEKKLEKPMPYYGPIGSDEGYPEVQAIEYHDELMEEDAVLKNVSAVAPAVAPETYEAQIVEIQRVRRGVRKVNSVNQGANALD